MSGRARPIGVAVLGLGYIGRTHVAAYRAADAGGAACRLVAVCDPDPARRSGAGAVRGNLASGAEAERLFDPERVRGCAAVEDVLADPEVDLVSVCTPTDAHVDLAIACLAAGKHVLVEKPVALTAREVARLGAAARAAADRGLLCMPALCMRFWPGWTELADAVRDRRYGAVKSASFQRLSPPPAWSAAFYRDPSRSGGALCDLHLHDADFVVHLFGVPASVASTGSLDHVTTLYRYPGGHPGGDSGHSGVGSGGPGGPAHVVAEGGWDLAPGFAFRMRYVVAFERATLDFDLARDPQLLLCREGRAEPIALAPTTGYEAEVRHLLAAIRGTTPLAVTLADAQLHARVLDAERASLERGGEPVTVERG